ncbi:aliphatic sulfonate ABC transporter substrate-binding protein [Leifsonia shinshuensis]|uniref:Aliphatic sulfonate ABC transporter substrate-binding protein n=1 Tax=Leifsonia shinshuensis TaxID=150026 RepID=A0A7G6Y6B6_9MICO|nr:aliphatic sulfonate ABC transporter substrate-binding protein [Leifsonia shinshuensis]QNE34031.1 aliphatic sulfonate ABC transporter substrate-binding protein [Leifsonia shinshuensis]
MRTIPARLGIAALAAGALVLSLAACSTGSANAGSGSSASATSCSTTQNVNFGYIGDFNGTSLLAIAKAKNMWAAHCLNVNPQVFTNGPLQITAMASGSLDFGYIGPGALWLPASGKAKIVAIDTFTNADRIVALPGKGIKSIKDLKGKKVAYPKGTSGEMILRLGLQKAGMSMSDIDATPLDYSTLTSALSAGQFDAAGFGYPQLTTVKKQQPGIIELAKDSDFASSMRFVTAFVARENLPTQNPKMVSAVLAVLKEANDYRLAHRTEAINLVSQMTNVPVDQVTTDASFDQLVSSKSLEASTKSGDVDKWLDTFGQYFTTVGTLQQPGSAKDYYTSDLYAKAGH